MSVTTEDIKKLRKKTGAGIMDCKKALKESNGDFEKAIVWLRQKGLSSLAEKADREAKEGLIESYIHTGGKVGVLLEVNCETDFVARNDEFKEFVHDLAMQIAAQAPLYISREKVPREIIEKQKGIFLEQLKEQDKPEHVMDKIIDGKLEKYFQQVCLLEQPFIKNPDITIKDYLGEVATKLGENIIIRRYVRYVLGEME